jgi:anionic cell wall polymer biosynthesis LytR-Cps2A-Psr (LCP) family protein
MYPGAGVVSSRADFGYAERQKQFLATPAKRSESGRSLDHIPKENPAIGEW